MIDFLIKKAFFDAWDNLIKMVIFNLGFLVCLALGFFLPNLAEPVLKTWSLLLALPGILLAHVYAGVVSSYLMEASDYKSAELRDFTAFLAKSWKPSLLLGLINCAALFLFIIAFPFYLAAGGILGAVGAGVVFWMGVFWLMASQYYLPLTLRMGDPVRKVLKKCFIMLLDNPGFTFFMMLWSAVIMVCSIVTALILPGISGLLFWHQDAFKLRLYKYDWLEEEKGRKSSEVPWEALFRQDKDAIGPRSIKSMIFPWKD